MTLTATEENYLKTIYKIYERSKNSVSTNAIASHLETSAASVTDMLKKLSAKKLIAYERYKGSKLTEFGSSTATSLIRRHRLWETFLVDKLDFSWEEVHDIAEELEHISSVKLIDRLDKFLGYPKYDPHGDPIPNSDGKFTIRSQTSLGQMSDGDSGVLVGVSAHDNGFLEYLNALDIAIGASIVVIKKNNYDKSMSIQVNNAEPISITEKVGNNLLLKKH